MKAGRNDPCPCGSGKKYKKCCLAKNQEQAAEAPALAVAPTRSLPSSTPAQPSHAGPILPPRVARPPTPPLPPDPIQERADLRWKEFESRSGEERVAVFRETLEDAEVMTDDFAFEALAILHTDAVKGGDRGRFAECVGALRERRPEVFDKCAHFYLWWGLQDALAEDRHEIVSALARELAPRAGRSLDNFNRAAEALSYHGQLSVLVEVLRIAWPGVKSSDDYFPWVINEFAETGTNHVIFDYLEHTAAPDPTDPVLLDRIRFFIEEPREDFLREFVEDLTGEPRREWQTNDFALEPPKKTRRDEWDDDDDEDENETKAPSQGALNLTRLIGEFVGYLRRDEGVPFPRGELVRHELFRYFVRRNEGDLNPRLSMLELATQPNRKLPKPPRPVHPLCPERVTLEIHLATMMRPMSGQHHSAAALFQAMPAWLRFLESRRLIDAGAHKKVLAELRPLHATLVRFWEQHLDDPSLYRQGQAWPSAPLPAKREKDAKSAAPGSPGLID